MEGEMGSEDSYGATKKEPSKWIQSEIKEKGGGGGGGGKTKGEKKLREKHTPPQKHSFGCALVGLCLWRSTATYSITRKTWLLLLLMQGVGEREGKAGGKEKKRSKDKKVESWGKGG
jgi:hypothetical protein